MLNTSPTELNSFNGLPGIENRKERIKELMDLKEKATQMAQAGADPKEVKRMVQEGRKALATSYPDEVSYKKAVNAAQTFQGMSGGNDGFNAPSTPQASVPGGFNPGFGMVSPTGATPASMRPQTPPPQEAEIDRLYSEAGFKGGPAPRMSNTPGEIVNMLPHDLG
jgi:hypothetical protein